MKAQSLTVILLAGAFLAACGSNDNDPLVGSWIRMRTPTEMRDRYVFGADGAFTFDENKPDDPQTEDHLTGTYVAAGGMVTATVNKADTPGTQARLTFTYHANATQFSSAALRATAGHAGAVGVWTGMAKIELTDGSQSPSGGAMEVALRADGTFRWTVTPFDGTAASAQEGTWVTATDGTIQTATASGPSYVLRMLDNEVLVDEPRIWQRN